MSRNTATVIAVLFLETVAFRFYGCYTFGARDVLSSRKSFKLLKNNKKIDFKTKSDTVSRISNQKIQRIGSKT